MQLDIDKAINTLLYISASIGRADFHKVFKILYFAEQEHLAKYGSAIVGEEYIRMKYGPVPSSLYDMLKMVRGDYSFPVDAKLVARVKETFGVEGKYFLVSKINPDKDVLAETEVECLENSIQKNKHRNFNDLTLLSHDTAWNNVDLHDEMSLFDIAKAGGADENMLAYIKVLQENQDILT